MAKSDEEKKKEEEKKKKEEEAKKDVQTVIKGAKNKKKYLDSL